MTAGALLDCKAAPYPFASSASIAATSRGSSAVTSGANRLTTLPLRPIRNFSKFHNTSCSPLTCWEINGTEGDLRISGPGGHAQLVQLSLAGGRGGASSLQAIPLSASLAADTTDGPRIGNVKRVYAAMARDLREGTSLAPSFDDAVQLHRVLAAIEQAAVSGLRVRASDM